MSDNKPVIVGVDGSSHSRQALEWAFEYGRRYEVPIEAVNVWQIPPASMYAYLSPAGFGGDVDITSSLQNYAQTALDETVDAVLGRDAPVTKRVEQGHPAAVLVDAAASARLLVVGSRGHGAFVGMLIGSVSQHCVAHAPCPVTVVSAERDDQSAS